MLRRNFLTGLIALAVLPDAFAQRLIPITVYKSATCGCCKGWVKHLSANGFKVDARDVVDLDAVKARLGVPSTLAACHTASVDGYVVEGHVPAADIRKLLDERPAAHGLAVPGMPAGSPGMESSPAQPYATLLFDARGGTRVYARH